MISIANTTPNATRKACLPDGRIEPLARAHYHARSTRKWQPGESFVAAA